MPTIPLLKKPFVKQKFHRKQTAKDIERRKFRKKYYNNSDWKKLRLAYLQQHPLCENCLKKGIVNGTDIQVHHIQSPFEDGLTEMDRMQRLLSFDNLESLCARCHGLEHLNKQINKNYYDNKDENKKRSI